jgi:DegV family protein with EDD domain
MDLKQFYHKIINTFKGERKMDTVLIIDSCSDLPYEFISQNSLIALNLTFHFKDSEYKDDFGKTISYKEFYTAVRGGEMPTTSQINVNTFEEEFKKHVKENKPIIYIGFSSALSGCVNSATVARENILEEFKDADITVIDSKSASLGYGMLVYYAVQMRDRGSSKDEIVNWIETNKLKMNHWFTVDDLHHLKRGGRVSGAAAVIGTFLDIKPVLHVDNEGRLIPVTKVRGRKKSIEALFEKMKERIMKPEEQVIAISHGDCIEDVEYLKNLINDKLQVKDIIVNNVGPVIGAHSGPGTVALFFLGYER